MKNFKQDECHPNPDHSLIKQAEHFNEKFNLLEDDLEKLEKSFDRLEKTIHILKMQLEVK